MDVNLYIIIVAVIAAIAFWSVYLSKVQKMKLCGRLKDAYGAVPDRQYDHDHYACVSHYFEKHRDEGFYVDDITWNDLDMDRIFMLMNNTQSSAGEEYLYKTLRMPSFDEDELKERGRLMRFFDENEDVRLDFQTVFRQMGCTKRISLADYLGSFLELESKKGFGQFVYVFLVIAAAVCMAFQASAGMVVLIAVLIINVNAYFKEKARIESYFVCTAYIARLVKGADCLGKRHDAELREYEEAFARSSSGMLSILKKASVIGNASNVTDGLFELIMQYVNMVFHTDLISFYSILDTVKAHMDDVERLLKLTGEMETAIAAASFRRVLPYWCVPEFILGKENYLNAEDLYHPLVENPVANCIDESRCVLLTGSNASGKSTFLKTVAVNAILAQSIDTCTASYVKTGFRRVMTSMALRDNLKTQESYYMVEIRSIKRIMTQAKAAHPAPVMCFIDEVLRGTNTVERIAASSRILLSLCGHGAFVFAATHDIELTHLLEKEFANYHFSEEVLDDDISFNYILNKGRSTSQNAIRLLNIMGYDKDVTEMAQRCAEHFTETGEWRL